MTGQENTGPQVSISGKLLDFCGYAYGLRHPCLLAAISLPDTPSDAWLARSIAALTKRLPEYVARLGAIAAPPAESDALAMVLLHGLYAMQQSANLTVFERGRLIGVQSQPGRVHLAVPVGMEGNHRATAAGLQWLVAVLNSAAQGQIDPSLLKKFPDVLKTMARASPPGSNVPRFLRAAYEMDMPFTGIAGNVVQFGFGARARWMESSLTDQSPVISVALARDKMLTAQVLRRAGVPVPAHRLVNTEEAALRAAEKLGYPVVVKPVNLDGGVGVAAGLMTPDEVRAAFVAAQVHARHILVEKHITGRDYRLNIFRGHMLWAIERIPAGVMADGARTIRQLVDETNADPRRGEGEHAAMKRLPLDDESLAVLDAAGLNADSIPPQGRFVPLRRKANIAAGGTPVAVFDQVHPDNRLLAIRAAAALHLDLAGVDLLIPDIRRSWKETGAAVCEVNAQPQLGGVTSGHVYAEVLKELVQGNGRIPIVVVVGMHPESPLVANIGARLLADGWEAAWLDHTGVTIGGVRVRDGAVGIYPGGQMLMLDKSVTVAVIGLNDASALRTGLPFDRFDLLVLAGSHLPFSGAAQGQRWRSALIDIVSTFLLPACRGKVLAVAGSGLDVQPPDHGRTECEWTLETVPRQGLLEAVVSRIGSPSGKG